jgi:hypothetical protein
MSKVMMMKYKINPFTISLAVGVLLVASSLLSFFKGNILGETQTVKLETVFLNFQELLPLSETEQELGLLPVLLKCFIFFIVFSPLGLAVVHYFVKSKKASIISTLVYALNLIIILGTLTFINAMLKTAMEKAMEELGELGNLVSGFASMQLNFSLGLGGYLYIVFSSIAMIYFVFSLIVSYGKRK